MENLTALLALKYKEAVQIVEKLDNGTWREDKEILKMKVEEAMAVREVKKQLEDMGIDKVATTKN